MYLGGVMLGQHEGMQDFVRVQTRRLRVEAAGDAPYQLDGDPGGRVAGGIQRAAGQADDAGGTIVGAGGRDLSSRNQRQVIGILDE